MSKLGRRRNLLQDYIGRDTKNGGKVRKRERLDFLENRARKRSNRRKKGVFYEEKRGLERGEDIVKQSAEIDKGACATRKRSRHAKLPIFVLQVMTSKNSYHQGGKPSHRWQGQGKKNPRRGNPGKKNRVGGSRGKKHLQDVFNINPSV